MRDIVSSGYNSATLPTKSRVARMNSSGSVKTDYKSYKDFLESYGDKNPKDDQESVSSTDSGISSSCKLYESKSNNTSTSSLNSEINGSSSKTVQRSNSNVTAATVSFKNYLENYNHKKFSSVKPNITSKQNLIKSEIVIQVNDPLEKSNNKSTNNNTQQETKGKTDAILNIPPRPSFANNKELIASTLKNLKPQREFKNNTNNNTESCKIQLQQLQGKVNDTTPLPPPPPSPQVAGMSGDCQNGFIPPPPPPPMLNINNQQLKQTTAKKWNTVEAENKSAGTIQNQSEKLQNHAAAANLAKILTQHLLPRRKELERLEEDQKRNIATSSTTEDAVKNGQDQKCKTYVSITPTISIQPEHKEPPRLPLSPPPSLAKKPTPIIFTQKASSTHSSPIPSRKIKNNEDSVPPRLPMFSPTMSKRFQNVDTADNARPRLSSPTMFPNQHQKVITTKSDSSWLKTNTANGRDSPNSNGNVDFNTTTVVPIPDSRTTVSKNDPNVRKLVYNTYRGLLGAYNNKANDMIATLPRNMVKEDKGVAKQLESIAQAAAPPPPPGAVGHIPSQRLKSEVSDRRVEPPLCVQNAMLTKDKKPFTYTPGGIDLSEIRSPRMQRRLERNAMNEGVAPLPQTQPYQSSGPLPPSALAAMQPQLPVQVFPAGGIPQPHHHAGGPPPPPPPPSGVPPPPPKAPPMRSTTPVPLDPFERPDMTKIIPENPMALLRKTAGPVVKRDPIFNKDNYSSPNNIPDSVHPYSQPVQRADSVKQPESPQRPATAGIGSIYVPPVNQNSSPSTPPSRQPQSPQYANQRESSPATARAPPAYYKRQPSTPQPEPQSPQFTTQRQSPAASLSPQPQREPQSPESPKVSLSKAPTPWLQKRPQQDSPAWAINDHNVQSPPIQEQKVVKPQNNDSQQSAPWRQHQSEPQQWQQPQQPEPQPWQQRQPQQPEPQPWQQRQQQQPQTPPWQQQQQQQPQTPPWQQQQQQQLQTPPWQQQQQQPQTPPWQQQQQSPTIRGGPQGGGVRKQVQQHENPQESGPAVRTEVVIVNDPPQVFQHPGPTQRIIIRQQPHQNNYQQNRQQQKPRVDPSGAIIIPVQIDGASSNGHPQSQMYGQKYSNPGTPTTPGSNSDARSLNRQLSWNSNPTQSNTFRVLQKITNTDGDDDDDDDQPITEHSPKMPHHFPQRQVSTDQELMNKFKQEIDLNDYYEYPRYRGGHIPSKLFWMLDDSGLDQDSSLHREVDPRYRGPHIPSKAFKLLQNMTGGPDEPPNSFTVPQGQPNINSGPKVRNIPIQIEGDGPPKKYVPPSEQTVPEPKKYMGSSIPSRSFKILQAMTGPDDCANPDQACENNENYANDPSSCMPWGFDPNYPPISPYYYDPYWGYYPQNYPPPNNNNNSNDRMTPTPWGYCPPGYSQNNNASSENSQNGPSPSNSKSNARMTPIPAAWGYCPPAHSQNSVTSDNSDSNSESSKKRSSSSSRTTPVPVGWTNDSEQPKRASSNPRCTPIPFWPYYYPNYSYENTQQEANSETSETDTNGNSTNTENQQNYPQYPPYWDPYYYGYYYGAPPPMYPPVYSPYPFYPPPQTDSEEVSGYSSNDEMAYYGARFASMPPSASKRPRSAVTPSTQKQLPQEIAQTAKALEEKRKANAERQKPPEKIRIQSEPFDDDSSVAETSDSESEMIGYEVCRKPNGVLKAIRSVSDVKVYDGEESSHCSDEDDISETSTEENDDASSICVADDTIPHQLSVIFEESERTDSDARYVRESSVATTISEGTATIENSEEEEDGEETAESDGTVLVKLPLKFKFNSTENNKVATLVVGNSEIKPEVVGNSFEEGDKQSNVRTATNKSEGNENILMIDNSITRQVSSDSYETAESDAEAFNTRDSNVDASFKSIEGQNKNEEEEEDIDWWGQLGKVEDDLPKSSKRHEVQNKQGEDKTDDVLPNTVASYRDSKVLCDTNMVQNYHQYKRKEVAENKEEGYSQNITEDNEQCTDVDLWTELQNDNASVKSDRQASNGSQTIENSVLHEEKGNDTNVKEGMETVETVLTNIISTINRRTSFSVSSEEEKSEEVDFWAEIMNSPEKIHADCGQTSNKENVLPNEENMHISSACSRNSSLSSSKVLHEENGTKHFSCSVEEKEEEPEDRFSHEKCIKTEEGNDRSISETNNAHNDNSNEENLEPEIKPLSVQERIKALHESATYKQSCQQEEEAEIKVSIKDRISVFEDSTVLLNVDTNLHKRKSISRKSSIKSYEEFSEEEGDSGVTSDISRHISETDTEPDFLELKKLNKYQRASTHSRLFKLLQDECDNEDVPIDSIESSNTSMQTRREHLNLPLQKNGSDPESFSSSGFTSPGSPAVNERLVNELVQSLLRKKQGKSFKHMTMEKIQAAALRILQEDMDGLETLSSSEDGGSFLSPKKPGTGNSTPAQTPQEFYGNFNEYSQYYDSWAEAARLYEAQCDILPSKAFRLIQDHAATNKTGAIAGLLARCPRVLSNKNVQKELIRLMEGHESPSPSPDPYQQPPHANEATNAS